jgi:hypothetical protein
MKLRPDGQSKEEPSREKEKRANGVAARHGGDRTPEPSALPS